MIDDPPLDRFPHTLSDLDGPRDLDEELEREERIGEDKADLERNEPENS